MTSRHGHDVIILQGVEVMKGEAAGGGGRVVGYIVLK